MRQKISLVAFVFALMGNCNTFALISESDTLQRNDTIPAPQIQFSPSSASEYLMKLIGSESLWRSENDTLKLSLGRLVSHFHEPFDSIGVRLSRFQYDSVKLQPNFITQRDTLPVRWLGNSLFFVDTVKLDREPMLTKKTIIMRAFEPDSATLIALDTIPNLKLKIDSILRKADTITESIVDHQYLESKKISLHRIVSGRISPPLLPPESWKIATFTTDSAHIVLSLTTRVIMADRLSPFYIVPGKDFADSLKIAVETLLVYTYERDSVLLFINDIHGRKTPFWLKTGSTDLSRYWLKNSLNDSITVWLGNPSKFDLSMILEEGITVERPEIMPADDIPISKAKPDITLAKIRPLKEIPVYWTYSLTGSFSLNQNYLTNWAQGGESSIASMFDIGGVAKYTNKESKSEWTNRARLRYGSVRTKEQGLRVNTDIFELNSQYNKLIINKLDFSSVIYFKSQVAKGYNYPNDSIAVSKFLNPGTFTIGAGVEYKPVKNTLLNFSPVSFKNTFVLDTTAINQTVHGIETGKRSRQELGGQLVIRNTVALYENLKISSNVRLFSNYIDKPQNVDVDWETTFEQQINWLFSIRLNFHLIYDDDIRFAVKSDDGIERKVAKTQFNQFLGLTLSVKL